MKDKEFLKTYQETVEKILLFIAKEFNGQSSKVVVLSMAASVVAIAMGDCINEDNGEMEILDFIRDSFAAARRYRAEEKS